MEREIRLQEGKTQEDLLPVLEDIADNLTVDKALVPGQEVVLKHVYEKGQLKRTGLYVRRGNKKLTEVNSTICAGKTYTKLCSLIPEETKEVDILLSETAEEKELSILALCSQDVTLTHEGKVRAHWVKFSINYLFDWDSENHIPKLIGYTTELSKEDHELLTTTNIAILHGTQLYGMSQGAIPSIGRLLDANSAFYALDQGDNAIFLAGEIAAKLSYGQQLSFIARGSKKNSVKVIHGVGGSRFVPIRQDVLFKMVYNRITETMDKYVPMVSNWKVTNEETEITIRLNPWIDDGCERGLILRTSDLSDTAVTLKAYVKIGDFFAYIKENRFRHTTELNESAIDKLFDGMQVEFDNFDENQSMLTSNTFDFNESWSKELTKIIGKGRMQEHFIPLQKYVSLELINKVGIECKLPRKQDDQLKTYYGTMLASMLKRGGM